MSAFDTSQLLRKIKNLGNSGIISDMRNTHAVTIVSDDEFKEYRPYPSMPTGNFFSSIRLESVVLYSRFYIESIEDPFPNFSFCFSFVDKKGRVAGLVETENCKQCGKPDSYSFPQTYFAHCYRVNGLNCLQISTSYEISQVYDAPDFDLLVASASFVLTENSGLSELYKFLPDVHLQVDCSNFFNAGAD